MVSPMSKQVLAIPNLPLNAAVLSSADSPYFSDKRYAFLASSNSPER